MRIEELHRLYVQELNSLYGGKAPTTAPAAYFIETEQQARQLGRIFEWLGQPPVLPQPRTQEEK